MIRRLVALLVAGAAVGAAVGWALSQAADETYRAAAVLHVLPAGEAALAPGGRLAAEVQAASYASLLSERGFLDHIRAQVAGGALSVDEVAERVAGRHEEGTALVRIVAEGPTRPAARGLASDVSSALLGYVRQTARQRAAQVEDELRRRIEELGEEIAAATGTPERLEALREERAALNGRLATLGGDAVDEGTRLVLAGPATPTGSERASPVLFSVVGGAVGLLAALVAALVPPRPRRAPRRAAPAPALVEPSAGAVLAGAVSLRASPAGAPVEVSRDGSSWEGLAADGTWDTASVADGHYLLRVRGSEEAVPVEVDNTPPTVRMDPPAPDGGLYRLSARAEDAGSGVASVTFMVSDGSPDWSEIPADWRPAAVGLYWLCAVAADRAGHRAASEPVPVRVE